MNIDKMVAAIEADEALIDGALCNSKERRCGHAGRCAIGAMLFHAGMSDAELKRVPGEMEDIWWGDTEEVVLKAKTILEQEYGLTEYDADSIVRWNDNSNAAIECAMKQQGLDRIPKQATKHDRLRAQGVIAFIRNGLKAPEGCDE